MIAFYYFLAAEGFDFEGFLFVGDLAVGDHFEHGAAELVDVGGFVEAFEG